MIYTPMDWQSENTDTPADITKQFNPNSSLLTFPFSDFRFICNCANITLHKGYKYFGIQFYTECWGGDVTDAMIQKMEISDKYPDGCVNTKDLSSTCNIEADKMCVGKALANFIYEVQIPTTQLPAAGKNIDVIF